MRGNSLTGNDRRVAGLLIISIFVITVAAYMPALQNGFATADDNLYISGNPYVNTGPSLDNLRWALVATHASNWHPLTWISLQLDSAVFGTTPLGYHLTNVLLHSANAVLLFLVFWRMTGAF